MSKLPYQLFPELNLLAGNTNIGLWMALSDITTPYGLRVVKAFLEMPESRKMDVAEYWVRTHHFPATINLNLPDEANRALAMRYTRMIMQAILGGREPENWKNIKWAFCEGYKQGLDKEIKQASLDETVDSSKTGA